MNVIYVSHSYFFGEKNNTSIMYNMVAYTYTLPLNPSEQAATDLPALNMMALNSGSIVEMNSLTDTQLTGATLIFNNIYDSVASNCLFTYTTDASGIVTSYDMNVNVLANLANIVGLSSAIDTSNNKTLAEVYFENVSNAISGDPTYLSTHWPAFLSTSYANFVNNLSITINTADYITAYSTNEQLYFLAKAFYDASQEAASFTPEVSGTYGVPVLNNQTIALPIKVTVNPNQPNFMGGFVTEAPELNYALILTLTSNV